MSATPTTAAGPYAYAARRYATTGLGSPIPLPFGQKQPPPPGYTGDGAPHLSSADVEAFGETQGADNIALRLASDVIAIDVDAYAAGATDWLAQHQLPATFRSTARADGVSGHYFYRLPDGQRSDGLRDPHPGIDLIREGHRYSVAPPSLHPSGSRYAWIAPHGGECPPPTVQELPLAPDWLLSALRRTPAPLTTAVQSPAPAWDMLTAQEQERHLKYLSSAAEAELSRLDVLVRPWREGAGWDDVCHQVATNLHEIGNAGPVGYLEELQGAFLERAPRDQAWHDGPERKWEAGRATAAGKARVVPAPTGGGFLTQPQAPAPSSAVHDIVTEALAEDDAVLAQQVADGPFSGRFRFSVGLGWLEYNGHRWVDSSDVAALEAVREWLIGHASERAAIMYKRLGDNPTQEAKDEIERKIARLRTLMSRSRIASVTLLARGLILCDASEFDREPHLLNNAAGFTDLRTGQTVPHAPEHLCRHYTPVVYEPGARHPLVDAMLEAIPADTRDYLHVRMGQAATGERPSDDVLPVLQGSGSNGKSSFIEPVRHALGSYAVPLTHRILTSRGDEHTTEWVDLLGARMAYLEELPDARIDSIALKLLVGTPTLKGRRMRADNISWTATHSTFVTTNYVPTVVETDHGTWRRLALVRWPYRYVPASQALSAPNERHGLPHLNERIQRDPKAMRAVLAWIVEGARRYYAAGAILPSPPTTVETDTLEWRRSSDIVLRFLEDTLARNPAGKALTSEVWAMFRAYSESAGIARWSEGLFKRRLLEIDGVRNERPKRTPADVSRPAAYHGAPLPGRSEVYVGLSFPLDATEAGGWTG